MLLGKEAILQAKDLITKDVEVKEWGGSVRLKTMTGAERDNYESQVLNTKTKNVEMNKKNFRTKLLVLTIVNEKNERVFTEEDIEALAEKSSLPIDMLATEAMKMNGILKEDEDELTKNS